MIWFEKGQNGSAIAASPFDRRVRLAKVGNRISMSVFAFDLFRFGSKPEFE